MIWFENRHRMITLLTGERDAGKTSLCGRIADMARAASATVAGVISPAIFRDGYKEGISVVDLRSGTSRPLAMKQTNRQFGEMGYRFDESSLRWANDAVASSSPCDLLVIDEIGPLEILHNRGFVAAIEVLLTGEYNIALVVVRPELIDAFRTQLGLPFSIRYVHDLSEDMLTDWPSAARSLVFGVS